jgi:putative addiction module component (TIGR02574 family)
MNSEQLLKEALALKTQEKFFIVEALLKSLDKPDVEIEAIWNEEIEKRSKALDSGKTKTIPYEKIF